MHSAPQTERLGRVDRLDALQALRALAAAGVVYDHGQLTFVEKIEPGTTVDPGIIGGLGVPVFFVISGFIIFLSASKLTGPPRESASYFFRRRLIRIVPLYWIATFVYGAKLAAQGNAPSIDALARSLTFLPYDDGTGAMRPVLPQGWTLNYEMLFYALFAITLLWAAAPRMRAAALFAILGSLMAARWLDIVTPDNAWAMWSLAQPFLLYFLAGVALALAWARWHHLRPVLPFGWVMVTVVALLAGYVAFGASGVASDPQAHGWQLIVCTSLVAVCVGFQVPASEGLLRRWTVLAGDGSYSTYLTHGFLLGPVARVLAVVGAGALTPKPFAILIVMACTAFGVAVYLVVEKPLLDRLNAKWG